MNKNEEQDIKDCIEEDLELQDELLDELDKDEYIAKLNDDLQEQQKKTDEYYEHLKRSVAEFDNFKKRIQKEKNTMHCSITSDLIGDLLPVLDNFEKAISTETEDQSFKAGMEMIYSQLKDLLVKFRVEEISATNVTFDPNLHEAVMHIEDKKYGEKEIVEVFRKGYKIGDKVIRHSMVKVAN